MTCTELCVIGKKTLYHTEKRGFGYLSFQKNSRHTHQNRLNSSPVSERSVYSLQNYVCFSPLTSGLESIGHKSTPLTGPGLRPTVQHSSQYDNGQGLECQKVNFVKYLGQGTLGCHSLSSLLFGCFSSPTNTSPTNIHTHSSQLFTLN